MAKYAVEMKSGELYEFEAINGDEAKRKAYDAATQKYSELARPENAGDPRRSVARVIHPEAPADAASSDADKSAGRSSRGSR